jgi:hypothetical protein
MKQEFATAGVKSATAWADFTFHSNMWVESDPLDRLTAFEEYITELVAKEAS